MRRPTLPSLPVPGRGVRTVKGPAQRVVIVGAGLGGLSCAMRLAGAGLDVTVVEHEAVPGGRAGRITTRTASGTYQFDTGPTVLTMPDLIDDCFDALDEMREDWLDLVPVRPLYRAQFADGSHLDVHTDTEQMAEAITAFCGPREADGYRRYVEFVSRLYALEMREFIDRNLDSPLDLASSALPRLARLGAARRLSDVVAEHFEDPRLQRIFSFQSLYAGVAPQDAMAIYAVIAYLDAVAGVYFPVGGMHALPQAMAAACEKHGVTFHYSTTVTRVERSGSRATGVITSDGQRFPADVVVLNPDLPTAKRDLLGVEPAASTSSPSCYLLLAGTTGGLEDVVHHTISFGHAWDEVFSDLAEGRLMSDPSILISQPCVSDPGLAPPDRSILYALFPTPNLHPSTMAPLDWQAISGRYREHVGITLQARGFGDLLNGIEVEHTFTPVDWLQAGMHDGTPFAAAHVFRQTGPFRAGNLWGDNVVFTGSGTTPGVGVPMVLVSGRLAAERITGPVPGYSSRAWR